MFVTYLIIYSSFDHFSSSGSMAWLKTVCLIHGAFDPRDVVILKTPNPILSTADIYERHE